MFVGISKNLGNGFRVGVGTNLSTKKKTQREITKEEDAAFIIKCNQRIASALLGYFHSHGVCVSASDIDVCVALPEFQNDLKSLDPVAARCGRRFALYNDTGKINQSGKEELLEGVYETESYLLTKRGSFDMARTLKAWHKGRPANIFALNTLKALLLFVIIFTVPAALITMNTGDNSGLNKVAFTSSLLFILVYFVSRKYKNYNADSVKALASIKQQISKPQKVLQELQ